MATLPLSTLDLTPGETRDHWVPLARSSDGAKRGAAATGAPGANTTEFSGQRQRVVHMPGTPAPAASPAAQPSGSGLDPGSSNWSTATGPFSSDSAATLAGQRSSAAAEAAAAEPPSTPGQPPPPQQRRGSATDDEPGLTPAGSPGDAAALQVAQEQQEAAEQEAAERAAAERAAAAALAGAASGTAAATPPRQGWRTRRKKGAAAAPPATPELPARLPSMLSGAAPTLASIPTAFEALAHDFARLAANPLDALRAKQCQLHIRTCYMPLTEAEKEAMVKEASRQRRGGRGLSHAPTAPAGQGPGRVKTLLFRWALRRRAAAGGRCKGGWGWDPLRLLASPGCALQPGRRSGSPPAAADPLRAAPACRPPLCLPLQRRAVCVSGPRAVPRRLPGQGLHPQL